MSMFGREALRLLREKQANPEPQHQASLLDQISPDAPMDDATLTVWNGERWAAYDRWLATAPIVREENRPAIEGPPADATCVAAECGGTRIRLVKDGERWLMYAGSRKAGGRRRDFASPFLPHAIRTAEQWYGAAGGGWRAEKGRDGRAEAADLCPQDSTVEQGKGRLDDLYLDGREPGR